MAQVSIIIPTYNRARLLLRALQSVAAQTFQDYELIIVDDGSTDDTRQVVDAIGNARIRYIWQENQERSAARNRGLAESRGAYVTFLDSDDEFLLDKLTMQVQELETRPELGMVIGGRLLVDTEGAVTQEIKPWEQYSEAELAKNLRIWLMEGPACIGAELVRREWLEKIGGFDQELVRMEDVDLWFRLAKAGCRAGWVHMPVVKEHFHPLNSPNEVFLARDSFLKYLEKAYADVDLAQRVGITKDQAKAEVYCYAACREYAADQIDKAQADLSRACQLDPSISAGNWEKVLGAILGWAWNPAVENPPGYVEKVFSNLPENCRGILERRRWTLSRAWMAMAFRAFRIRQRAEVLRAARQAAVADPRLLLNRGMISITVRSILNLYQS